MPPRPPDNESEGNGVLVSYAESNSSFEILSYEGSLHREESPCPSHYGDERVDSSSDSFRSRCASPFPMFFPYDASESRERDHILCSRKPSSGLFLEDEYPGVTDKHCKQKALGSSYHQGTVMNTGTKPPPYSDHPAERLFYEFFFDSSSILYDVHISNEDLGTGSYGRVQVATYSQIKVAVKSFHVFLQGSHRHIQKFKDECQMLNTIKHPNVVQFLGVHMDSRTHRPYLVMELMEGGSLYELIDNVRDDFQRLSFSRRLNIITDVASAIAFLHNPHNLVHRDLSSKNVLLTRELRAKISDFGMARPFTSSLHNQPQTKAPGCTPYMPPEALRDNTTFTEKGDVFSLGVVMIEVVTGCYPSPSSSTREVNENTLIRVSESERRTRDLHLFSREIKRAKSPQHLRTLVKKIIRDNPTDRPNANHVVHALTHIVSLQHEEKYDYTAQPMTTRALSCESLCTQMQDDNRTPQPEDSGNNPGNSTELVITTRCSSEFSPNAGVEAEHTSHSPQATICESTCSQEENQYGNEESQSGEQESQSGIEESQSVKEESQHGEEESQYCKEESQYGKKENQSGKRESQSDKRESQSGKRESQSDKRESQSGKRESQSDKRESQSGKRESQSGKQESQSDKRESQSGKRESQSGKRESQSGKRESQSGKRESQSDKRESQSGKRESQSGKRESQSGKRESQSGKRESQSGKRESQSDKRESQSGKRESQSDKQESQSGKQESQSGKQESQCHQESGEHESQYCKKESQNSKEESQSGSQPLHYISFVPTTMTQITEPHTTPPMQETDSEESNQLLLVKDEALLKTEKPSENPIATSEEMQPMEASKHEPFHEKETVSGICYLDAEGEHVYSYVQQAADECHQELPPTENEVDENLFTISKESVDQGDSKTQLVGISQPIFCQQANTSAICLSSVDFALTRLDENIDDAESVSTECPRSPSVLKPIAKHSTTALVPSKDFDHERASSHSSSPTFNPLSLISPHRDMPLVLFFQNMVSHLYRSLRYEVAIKTIFEPQCELSQNYPQPRSKSLKFFCEEFSQHSLSKFFSQSAPPFLPLMSLNLQFIDKTFLQSRTPATERTPSALFGSGRYAKLCAKDPGQEKLSALKSTKHSCKSRARNEHLYEIVTHARSRYNEQILSTLHFPSVSMSAVREYLLPIVAKSCLVYLLNLLYHTNSTLHKQSCIVSTICLSAKSLCSPQTNRCNNPYFVHCFFKLISSFSSTSSLYQDLKRNGSRLFQRHGQPANRLLFPCYSSQTHSNSLSSYSESISVDHECQGFEILFTYGNYSKCIHMAATDYQIATSVKMHSPMILAAFL